VAPARAAEAANEAVRSAARTPDYDGVSGGLQLQLEVRGSSWSWSDSAGELTLTKAFEALAREDLTAAALLAKTLTGDAARSHAVITVARTVLAGSEARR
jgi:hypothetical protein